MASMVKGTGENASVKNIVKSLLSSLPFDAYVIMTILAMLELSLPDVIVSFAATVGASNAFLALLMIGIGFEIRLGRDKIFRIFRLMALRYGTALIFSLAGFYLLPFELEVRQAMAIAAFGPVSSVATAFTGKLGGDVEMSSAVNSMSIVLSMAAITVTLILVL